MATGGAFVNGQPGSPSEGLRRVVRRVVGSTARAVDQAWERLAELRSGEPVPALPTFLVIGTMKGGTSSLHQYLSSHPEISMSDPKETDFLLPDGTETRTLDWYRSLFDGRLPVRGESSPNYTKRQAFPGVPERARALMPGVKLIYLVRDPVERTRSHFLHAVHKGRRGADEFEDVVFPPSGTSHVLDASCYHHQLTAWLRWWSLADVLVVDSDDLRRDRHATIAAVFRFLEVDDSHVSPVFDQTLHRTADKFADIDPAEVALPTGWRERVQEALAPDLEAFRRLTGATFPGWSM